ncbi:hypothetical protein BSKO_03852 [Bryopsis sp. KO-2023]|nr:hypothetical protein BSKO_03852 [Bryopsis sp. KO-2023]
MLKSSEFDDAAYAAQYKAVEECFLNYKSRMSFSGARFNYFKEFRPKPSDVVLLSPLKCGSTWTQQIMHGLRSRGNMDFDDINRMAPVLELALDDGYDIHGDQPYSPRCFKVHLCWEDRPKGHKYIIVIRDPKDSLVSLHEFLQGWLVPDDTNLDIFAKVFYVHHSKDVFPSVHDAIASWWPHRLDPDTLWLHYEDLKAHLPAVVELIAEFMGFDTGDRELLDIATKQASYEFMKAHEDKFRTELRGVSTATNKGPSKVNKGVGNRKHLLTEATNLCMDEDWKKFVQPVTGFSNYSDMRDHINREMGRPWAVLK